MKQKLLILLLLSLFSIRQTLAQERIITGKVTDSKTGNGVPGISVFIKGTTVGAITDADGKFSISANEGNVLVIQGVGFNSQEVTITGQSVVDVKLTESSQQLDEVVVVGYGTQERKSLTGSVAGMKNTEIQNIPVTNVVEAMQGRMAGVQIQSASGRPGSANVVRVRGQASITAGNTPLYVVDGVPITNSDETQSASGQGLSPLAFLNQDDIESIQVLKDASAAAIYGSRASNGVILITTKKGKQNQKTAVNFSAFTGVQEITKKPSLLNASQYREILREARANAGLAARADFAEDPSIVSTDWVDEILRSASRISNYQLSASGGSEKTRFFTSVGYFTQDAVLNVGNFKRLNARLNVEHQATKKLNFGINIGMSNTTTRQTTVDNSIFSPWPLALNSRPDQSVYNSDGRTFRTNSFNNPVHAMLPKFESNISQVIANLFVEYEIIKGLKYKILGGADVQYTKDFDYNQITSLQSSGTQGSGTSAFALNTNLLIENTLSYTKAFLDEKLKMNVLVGHTFQNFVRERNSVSGQGFPSDNTPYITSAASITLGSSDWTSNALESLLGRVNLEYNDRYLLSMAIRRDGSSKLVNQRYDIFPSISAGWRISSESFMESIGFIDDLKLRAGYGLTGNQEGIGNFASRPLFGSGSNYNDQPGLAVSQIGNEDLRWEYTEQANFGLDLGILNSRIVFNFDYYIRNTNNLLLAQPIPITSGFNSFTNNVGKVRNAGLEINIQSINIDKEFRWTTNFNIATNRNEVIALYNNPSTNQPTPIDAGFVSRTGVGQPIGSFFVIKALGVNPQTGDMIYEDLNGNGIIGGEDRQFLGNPFPDVFGGLTNNFSYKGFDLSVFFQYSFGNDVYKLYEESNGGVLNLGVDVGTNTGNARNMTTDVLRRWRQPGDITDMPRAITGARGVFNTQRSSRFIEDGSYVRLKNISLGYTVPKKWMSKIGVTNARVYISAQNLITFTNYSGFDPEVSSSTVSTQIGVDQGALPQLRTYTFGINLGF
ncbi:MAG: TonB-dependent receptor [Microscillaceae bacterium]|jgi:TonB-linked SusC/RagA family outer membrane protein|nr:TonB-dependent receptor [Microscillaceae bacterium]